MRQEHVIACCALCLQVHLLQPQLRPAAPLSSSLNGHTCSPSQCPSVNGIFLLYQCSAPILHTRLTPQSCIYHGPETSKSFIIIFYSKHASGTSRSLQDESGIVWSILDCLHLAGRCILDSLHLAGKATIPLQGFQSI